VTLLAGQAQRRVERVVDRCDVFAGRDEACDLAGVSGDCGLVT
jgi:hypothetical protein